MGTKNLNELIDKIRDFLNELIDWFKEAYYFATTYIDDPFDENN